MSACIAARLSMVSSSDSPLLALEAEILRLITSADRRLEAISKVVRVRVEFSKNRLKTLLPRISGTFLTSRSEIPTNEEAVSRMWLTIDFGKPSIVSRCCSSPCLFSCGLSMVGIYGEREFSIVGLLQDQGLARRHRRERGHEIGGHWQLALAPINQGGQHDLGRTAIVEQLIDGRARSEE